jgi:hypothetical protein
LRRSCDFFVRTRAEALAAFLAITFADLACVSSEL